MKGNNTISSFNAGSSGQTDNEIKRYLQLVNKRKWLILITFLITFFFGCLSNSVSFNNKILINKIKRATMAKIKKLAFQPKCSCKTPPKIGAIIGDNAMTADNWEIIIICFFFSKVSLIMTLAITVPAQPPNA